VPVNFVSCGACPSRGRRGGPAERLHGCHRRRRDAGSWHREASASEGWNRVLAPLREVLSGADARLVNLESAIAHALAVQQFSDHGYVETRMGCSAGADRNHSGDRGKQPRSGCGGGGTDEHEGGTDPGERDRARRGSRPNRQATAEPLGPITVVTANLTRSPLPPGNQIPIPTPDEVSAAVRAARDRIRRGPVLVILHGGREMDPNPSSFRTRLCGGCS